VNSSVRPLGALLERRSRLIESGLSVLRLQRWMGHHSPAFTLETYGHLLDGDLGPALDLRKELRPARR
jgi:integrase